MDEDVKSIFGLTEATAQTLPQKEDLPPTPEEINPALAKPTPASTPMTRLASFVMDRFKENEDARRNAGVTDALDYCARANRCRFSDEQFAKLALKFSPEVVKRIFVPITATKIRSARAMLADLVNQSGDPLFRIEPTPSPEVPESVSQAAFMETALELQTLFQQIAASGVTELPPEALVRIQTATRQLAEAQYDAKIGAEEEFARNRAERMQDKVWDLMLEGGFKDAFVQYLDDICTYGTGVIVGPVVRNVARNVCKTDKNGVVKYRRVTKAIPTYEAISPFDCYPAPDAKDIDDGPLCFMVRYPAEALDRYASEGATGGDGWIRPAVKALVAKHTHGGVKLYIKNYDPERRFCENNGFEDTNDCLFEGVRCFATVRGSQLLEMNIRKDRRGRKIESDGFYKTETIVIDNVVVYCRIYDVEMETPVSRGMFYTIPGSWWGGSIAEKVAMCQTVMNNCIKALIQNMPLASGPIIWVNEAQRLVNKSPNGLKVQSGDVLAFGSSLTGNAGAPMGALSVPSNANELLAVFKQYQTQADLDSGLPAYTEGQSAGQAGALRTASGLAIFTEASNRGMKMVMHTTDRLVINRVARMTADWVLLNDDNMDLKGDVSVVSVGLVGKVMKAQRDQTRLQLLQLVLNSKILTQALGIRGILEMLRPSVQDLDLDENRVMPSKSRMDMLESIEGIRQVFEATSATAGVQQNTAEAEGGGAPGVAMPENPEPVQGGVAERQGVA